VRSREEVELVLAFAKEGLNHSQIARRAEDRADSLVRGIFGGACDQLGVEWRPHNWWSLSVARRGSAALLDAFVGPKR
jgi:hypothetical protein